MDKNAESSSITYQLIHCTDFAARKHSSQRRKDVEQTPYINHPIGVSRILTHEGKITDDVNVIKAALLHDTVEDTDTTIEEIRQEFGDDVAGLCLMLTLSILESRNGRKTIKTFFLVSEVTDDKSLPSEERKHLQIEHAPVISVRARLVKLADKLYNLRDLERGKPVGWSDTRVKEYFEWAARVVHGLRGINKPMEDALDEIFTRHGVLHLAK